MRVIDAISRVMGFTATGIMIPMMVLTVVDVFLRFVFNSPITGVSELTTLMMVCLPLAIAWAAVQKRHVSVNLVMSRFPPRVQAIVGSVTFLIGLGTVVFLVWKGFVVTLFEIEHRYYASLLLPLPVFPFHWVLLLGLAMLCVVLVTLLIKEIKGAIKT